MALAIVEAILSDQNRQSGGSAYSGVEHLARSLWLGRFNWSNRMAMYSAYFDESGDPDSSVTLIVAGCIAEVEQWVHFEREWKAVLAPFGTEIFHANSFYQGGEPFHNLSPMELHELALKLAGIICRRVERTVASAIPLRQYDVMNDKYVFAEYYGFPYPTAARTCISHVTDWTRTHGMEDGSVLCFFEDGAKHKGQLEWIAQRDKLKQPIFLKKDQPEGVPLQAADFLAWHWQCAGQPPDRSTERSRAAVAVMERLAKESHLWTTMNLEDPDRLPTIIGIPARDKRLRYRFVLIRDKGQKRAMICYTPRTSYGQIKLNRKTMVLPDQPFLTHEEADRIASEYDARRERGTGQ